jgi:hypothetical protein
MCWRWPSVSRKSSPSFEGGLLTDPYSFGAAFSTVVKSLVSDVILPVVSLLPFFNRSLDEKFVILKPGTWIIIPTCCSAYE